MRIRSHNCGDDGDGGDNVENLIEDLKDGVRNNNYDDDDDDGGGDHDDCLRTSRTG